MTMLTDVVTVDAPTENESAEAQNEPGRKEGSPNENAITLGIGPFLRGGSSVVFGRKDGPMSHRKTSSNG